jgi:hypothetical protein
MDRDAIEFYALILILILFYIIGNNIFKNDTSADKLSKICAIVQADSDYIDNDSELYKACEGI